MEKGSGKFSRKAEEGGQKVNRKTRKETVRSPRGLAFSLFEKPDRILNLYHL